MHRMLNQTDQVMHILSLNTGVLKSDRNHLVSPLAYPYVVHAIWVCTVYVHHCHDCTGPCIVVTGFSYVLSQLLCQGNHT
jgi:hypothetical protein